MSANREHGERRLNFSWTSRPAHLLARVILLLLSGAGVCCGQSCLLGAELIERDQSCFIRPRDFAEVLIERDAHVVICR